MSSLRILFVGQTVRGSRTFQRIKALEKVGHQVEVLATNLPNASYEDRPSLITRLRYRLRCPADTAAAGPAILAKVGEVAFDILWLEREYY